MISAFGFGASTGSSERSYGLIYIEVEDAAVVTFLNEGAQCVYVAKVTMGTSTLLWSCRTCVASAVTFRRDIAYDPVEENIYFASDYAENYVFVCKLRSSDGITTFCIKVDGNSREYPYNLKIVGDFLLL